MIKDKLCLNDSKTEFIIIGTKQQLAKVNIDSLCVGDTSIVPVTSVKNLGFWFNEHVSMVTHINKLCKAASFHLYNIRRIRKYLTSEATQSLVHAIIMGRLDYCNSLLFNTPATHIGKLQRIQNCAARLVNRTPKFDHTTPTLKRLHWLSVCLRIEYKMLILTFKAIYGVAPSYICNLIKIREQTRFNPRSCKELLLEPSRVKTKKTLGDKSFQVAAAPGLWNKLPSEIRAIRSYDHFKRAIKTYLFKKAFACYS